MPGTANCIGESVAALAKQCGGSSAAAAALGYPSVSALQSANSGVLRRMGEEARSAPGGLVVA